MMTSLFKRILQLIFVLWGISTIVFFLERFIPGSPAETILGADAPDIDKLAWLAKYGLDKPVLEQYFHFLKNLLVGDFGKSFTSYKNVTEIILPRLLETLKLASCSFVLSLIIATIFGLLSAAYQGKTIDKLSAILSLLAISAPSFIIGPILMWIFSVKLDVLPLMGNANWSSFILPCITLGTALAAFTSRMIRSGLVDVLQEDYIRTARSKGLSEYSILLHHALRNAFLPTLTILGMQLGVLLSGTIITEQIFNWPGLGSLVLESVQQREYNIISGCVIIMATVYVLCNLAVDLLYQILDPRVGST